MSTTKKKSIAADQETIDGLVTSQSEENSAWGPPVRVKRSKTTSLSIPGELAARAAFLAGLHHETNVEKWVERVLREKVELEELAFAEVKKSLAS